MKSLKLFKAVQRGLCQLAGREPDPQRIHQKMQTVLKYPYQKINGKRYWNPKDQTKTEYLIESKLRVGTVTWRPPIYQWPHRTESQSKVDWL